MELFNREEHPKDDMRKGKEVGKNRPTGRVRGRITFLHNVYVAALSPTPQMPLHCRQGLGRGSEVRTSQ